MDVYLPLGALVVLRLQLLGLTPLAIDFRRFAAGALYKSKIIPFRVY